MARLARLVAPGLPHHVTQRGNGGARTFFEDYDYALYRDLLAQACAEAHVEVWAWCLMPNHVHLILVPADADGLRRALSRRLAARAQDWRWSSVRAHLHGREDGLTARGPVLGRFSPFRDFLDEPADPEAVRRLRAAASIGRPLGDKAFLARLERLTKRTLQPAKRGLKPRPE